ncbi:hypothetical protein BH20ACI2_BH20ACI2_07200 [soil metagenome]
MFRHKYVVLMILAALLMPGFAIGPAPAAAPADAIAKIKDEGMNRSQAMATIRYLTDVIGPRLTNSPAQKRANQWTKDQLEKWGMKNGTVDPWGEFGRGWEVKRFSASFSTPAENGPFRAYPKAWSPSTAGPITGDAVFVDATDEAGLEKFKGKLKGAIVFTSGARPVSDIFKPTATRETDENLSKMEDAKPQGPLTQPQPQPNAQAVAAQQFNARKNRFYFEEGAAVLVDSGFGVDGGTIRVWELACRRPPRAQLRRQDSEQRRRMLRQLFRSLRPR